MKLKFSKILGLSALVLCLSLSSTVISKEVCYKDGVNADINYKISCDLDPQSVC